MAAREHALLAAIASATDVPPLLTEVKLAWGVADNLRALLLEQRERTQAAIEDAEQSRDSRDRWRTRAERWAKVQDEVRAGCDAAIARAEASAARVGFANAERDEALAKVAAGLVTTAAELEALPVGVVVRSSAGSIACRWDGDPTRGVIFGRSGSFPWSDLALPVTVLWRPDAAALTEVQAGAGEGEPWCSDDCAADEHGHCVSEAIGCKCSCHESTDPAAAATTTEAPRCSCCGSSDLASATGVCVACGYDEMDYYDDLPEVAAASHAGCPQSTDPSVQP